MLTAHISKYSISADWDSCFQLCIEPLTTGYYLKAKLLSYYIARNSDYIPQITKCKHVIPETWKILKLHFDIFFSNSISK